MKYSIRNIEAFSVVGQEIELTNFQRKNIGISTQFWRTFNTNLKRVYLAQSGNWIKYAFMIRQYGKLFYYCAVPKKIVVPEGFVSKEIKAHRYLVADHVGHMDRIYDAYGEIYREILPNMGYTSLQEEFLHFERYDYRFHWNKQNSIIEIWVPIEN